MVKKKLLTWKELPAGDIMEAGTAVTFETGSWRTTKPKIDLEKCSQCLLCWIYCPDSSVTVKDGKITGFDYDHCKGCGICAEVCPPKVKAILMIPEHE